ESAPSAATPEPEESDPAAAGTIPLAAAGAAAAVTTAGEGESTSRIAGPTDTQKIPATPAATEEDPFAEFDEGPTSRAAAHWWNILIAVVFTPVAWYLVADGGER